MNQSLAAKAALFIDHDQPFTTSRAIAEHFGKQHLHVLRTIKKLISNSHNQEFTETNFGLSEYRDSTGRSLPEYHLTHDGFALLAMGFTGKKALAWKIAFLAAFNAMETELRAARDREAAALYAIRPHWQQISEATAAGLDRAAICKITGHRSRNTITANRRRMRAAGLLI